MQTLAQWVQRRWALEVQPIITRAAQLGVTNAYKNRRVSARSLGGIDRGARAFVGARAWWTVARR